MLTRLTLPGSLYLASIAMLPSLFIRYGGFSQATSRALGGTSVLIVVGVALDTMRQMESQMMMRSYEGFLQLVNLLVLGPQGAGKGTQAKRIAAEYGIPHVSTGDMFRAAIAAQRQLGRQVEPILAAGELVPDELTVALIRERLERATRATGSSSTASRATSPRPRRSTRCSRDRPRARRDPLLRPPRRRRDRADARRAQRGGPRRRHARGDRAAGSRSTTRETEPIVEHYRVDGKLVPLHAERPVDEVYAEIQQALERFEGAA